MALNEEKKKKLAELLAKRRAVAVSVGTSNPPPPATSAPNSSKPTPVDNRLKGVVVTAGTKDEDTSSGLVFIYKYMSFFNLLCLGCEQFHLY